MIIGGAGTCVPPVELLDPPLELALLALLELALLLLEVLVELPPKLLLDPPLVLPLDALEELLAEEPLLALPELPLEPWLLEP
jgi:hypothetical protein